ncbi:MAG: hypothetical protein ACYS8L_00025 [Planctomycetota bacterium]
MSNVTLQVDPQQTVREVGPGAVGINVNYLVDHDENRPDARPLEDALREMAVGCLRFPGGEKSDFHLWSQPPYDHPDPKVNDERDLSYSKVADEHRLMDFDDFIGLAQRLGAVPYVVTPYDNLERTGMTEDEFLEIAVAWVRYSNVKMGYGVKLWEIGNENWHNKTGTPEDLARVVQRFSEAMKAVDPSIMTGASGCRLEWWEGFLPGAAPYMDFLSVSSYPCTGWESFDYYRETPEVPLANQSKYAAEAIERFAPPADRDRLFVVSAEVNSANWAKEGWPNRNNLGHALVTIEAFGQLIQTPKQRHSMLWNTRWIDWKDPNSIWYGLNPDNGLLPPGMAVAAWCRFLLDRLVAIDRTDEIVTFASLATQSGELNLFLINKSTAEKTVDIQIAGDSSYRCAEAMRLAGDGPDDMHPVWAEAEAPDVEGSLVAGLTLPDTSLTVVSLQTQ